MYKQIAFGVLLYMGDGQIDQALRMLRERRLHGNGGAYLDVRPEFPTEVWADWEAEKREQFEERWGDSLYKL